MDFDTGLQDVDANDVIAGFASLGLEFHCYEAGEE